MNSPHADDQVKSQIRNLMARSFRGRVILDDDDIFALGFGTSLFAIQLVNFIEKTFDIEVESEDLDMANFKSINAVAMLVAQKRGGVVI